MVNPTNLPGNVGPLGGPLSTLKVANVQISASLSHVPPPAELIVIVQYTVHFDQRFTHVTFLFCRQSSKIAINLERIKSGVRKKWMLRVTEPLLEIVQ